MSNRIEILTLMSGRWYAWEPYWQSLLDMDWPRDKLSLTWYSNSTDQSFRRFLKEKGVEAKEAGFDIRVFMDDGIRVSQNAFVQGGMRTMEHALAICSLYNAAWKKLSGKNRVLMIEDDTAIPSHSAKRFMKALDENPKACYVSGVAFDRHSPAMFVWEFEKQPKGWAENRHPVWVSFSPQHTWGVRQVGAAGLGCAMIDLLRIPKLRGQLFKPQVMVKGAQHFVGCDIVFCFEVQQAGSRCLLDYDVRAFHYDSNGRPH